MNTQPSQVPDRTAPLLLIHGFPLSSAAWAPQVEALSRARRVIAPDLRGFGINQARPPVSSIDDYARDVAVLLDELEIDRVVLAGHSMGGYVTFAFARLFPERLAGLALVATRPGADSPEAATGRRETAAKVERDGTSVVIEAMTPKMLAPTNNDPAALARVRALMADASRAGVVAALHAMASRPDSTSLLASIAVPTLILTGADDVIIPARESELMAAAIPGAKLVIVPAAGHLVAIESPDQVSSALEQWLGGI